MREEGGIFLPQKPGLSRDMADYCTVPDSRIIWGTFGVYYAADEPKLQAP